MRRRASIAGVSSKQSTYIGQLTTRGPNGRHKWLYINLERMSAFQIQMTKEKEKRMWNVKHGLSDEDFKKEERIYQEIRHKYQDRIGKLLNIVDPNLGMRSHLLHMASQRELSLTQFEVSLGAKMKDVEKQALKKVDTLRMAAQRLAFSDRASMHDPTSK
ncbi:hypothetical protein GOP47_0009718 [Adiantum capillus-veneris]|uniref:Uncharacterized protein n=1 Tax=Adiantum capillus-veneris TaxID=13818 RepID=A0A9D4UYA9_ADICA|nr:hypothetical protein GOP47_0009718 [Adiantum capillus-veneris]